MSLWESFWDINSAKYCKCLPSSGSGRVWPLATSGSLSPGAIGASGLRENTLKKLPRNSALTFIKLCFFYTHNIAITKKLRG